MGLDIDLRWDCAHHEDVVRWVQRRGQGSMRGYGPGYFDFVWASPPCVEYSQAKSVGERRWLEADERVAAALRAIQYFRPKYFAIENPKGYLRHRPIMQGKLDGVYLPTLLQDVTYCKYGTQYMKPTNIWTNIPLSRPLKVCSAAHPCALRQKYGTHPRTAQSGPSANGTPGMGSAEAVYHLPDPLLDELFRHVEFGSEEARAQAAQEWAQADTIWRVLAAAVW